MIDQPQGGKPALTVVIQSWWTPALAVIMLVVGLLAGYFGRPLLNKNAAPTEAVAALVTQDVANPNAQATEPVATVDPTQQAINVQQMMDDLISQTKHFKGDETAKVTIIEFSDYQ